MEEKDGRLFKRVAIALTVCILSFVIALSASVQTIAGTLDLLKASSEAFNESEDLRYSFNPQTGIVSVFALKTAEDGIEYIADTAYIEYGQGGLIKILPDSYSPKKLTDEEARAIINRRLWLYKADKYDNTYMLDLTATPIKDADGTEWYPLLDDFSTQSKFISYLKEIFTDNLASNYIVDTSVRHFGNELYDIGGKVSQYSFDYSGYLLEQIFASDNGGWYFYKITVPMDEEIGTLEYTVGLYYSENGWKICYDGFKNTSETDYLEKIEQNSFEIEDDNPSTGDITLLYPLLSVCSLIGIVFLKIKK